MKILITGAAGFIGFHLTQRMMGLGHDVIGLDSINDYYDIQLKYGRLKETGIDQGKIVYRQIIGSSKIENFRFIQLKLEDKEAMMELFSREKFDYVCNLAAQAGVRYSLINPYAYISSNIDGFVNILEGARNFEIKHLVYASTSSVYGLNGKMPLSPHDSTEHPLTLYAATKKANELMAHSYSHLFHLPTTGLRFFTVYGPWGRPDMALFKFTKSILENEPIDIYNNGEMTRDFTFVADIIDGIVKILDHPASPNLNWSKFDPDPATSSAPYRIYNIGNSNPIKLSVYIEEIEKILKIKALKNFLPIQPGDVEYTFAEMEDLKNAFSYCPETPIHKGIEQFINWYKSYYKVD